MTSKADHFLFLPSQQEDVPSWLPITIVYET